jgi:2-aminoadipate transaminase
MEDKFASRMQILKASDIREILKITQNRDIISFAGGLPAPELFPTGPLADLAAELLRERGEIALQYSPSEGYMPLREKIAARMNAVWRTTLLPEEILITTGSQQGLELTGKLFLDKGDAVLCESPSYLGAIMAFNGYGPRWVEIPTDEDGMRMEAVEQALRTEGRVKMIYTIPSFQNPSGRTWSMERRRQLVQLAARYDVPIIEDNPYGELCFEGDTPGAMQAMDEHGLVISLGTFSKIFCPGLRVAWIAAKKRFIDKYVILKQAADLHSSTFDQMLTDAYLRKHSIDDDLVEKRNLYRRRRDAMVSALEREMPPGVTFTRPRGGLFLWVELPGEIDTRELLERCLKRGVAFVPGATFFPTKEKNNTMRLNYSNMPEARIEEGVRRLAAEVRAGLLKHRPRGRVAAEPEAV